MKYLVSLNGKQYEVIVEHHTANITNTTSLATENAQEESCHCITDKQAEHNCSAVETFPENNTAVIAPLPGTITKLNVKKGQNIKCGEVLCILEAMKMENEITSPVDGTIIKTAVQQGSAVQTDDILVVIG